MSDELELVQAIKLGMSVPGSKILERRTKGLSLIRQHFLARLVQAVGMRPASSLVVRWRGLGNFANSRTVVDESFELVLRAGKDPITGMFPDVWVVCYPDDAQVNEQVGAQMDRMCMLAAQRLTQ